MHKTHHNPWQRPSQRTRLAHDCTLDCKNFSAGSQRDDKVVTLKLFVRTLIITAVSSGFASSFNQHAACTNPPRILGRLHPTLHADDSSHTDLMASCLYNLMRHFRSSLCRSARTGSTPNQRDCPQRCIHHQDGSPGTLRTHGTGHDCHEYLSEMINRGIVGMRHAPKHKPRQSIDIQCCSFRKH